MVDTAQIRAALVGDERWLSAFDTAEACGAGIHLAVFVEPYLSYILEGKKTVESRFGIHRAPPFGCVETDDVVLLKPVAGPVVGIAQVANAWFYRLSPDAWSEIQARFGAALCLNNDDQFTVARSRSRFATLIRLVNVRPLGPLPVAKRDRRGWVVLRNAHAAPLLPGLEDFI